MSRIFIRSAIVPALIVALLLPHSGIFSEKPKVPTSREGWLSHIKKDLRLRESHIRWQEAAQEYQSPNRNQNLRISYKPDKVTLYPRDKQLGESWQLGFQFKGIGRTGETLLFPTPDAGVFVDKNHLVYQHEGFQIEYFNLPSGMRQNFILNQRPLGEASLKVALEVQSTLTPICVDSEEIIFTRSLTKDSNRPAIRYNGLKAWDATGKILETYMEWLPKAGNLLNLVVNDLEAIYPIIIDPLSSSADWTTESNQTNASLGWAVSTAGDLNGDGYSDIAVGAPQFDNGQTDEGKVFVFLGSAGGLASAPAWEVEGNQSGIQLGYSLSHVGDINGDGFSDLAIGAPSINNLIVPGSVWVFHGSDMGFGPSANAVLNGTQPTDLFGISLTHAGDVNGDTYSDILVGASGFSNSELKEGAAFLYAGSSSGIIEASAWSIESDQAGAEMGASVSEAGDVNADGFTDILIGVPLFDGWFADEGKVFLFLGTTTGPATTPAWAYEGGQQGAEFGRSLSHAGDTEGDGYADVVVGAPYYDSGQKDEGAVYLFRGLANGLNAQASTFIEGNQDSARLGWSVATAGDVDGNGYPDVIIGAAGYANPNQGKVMVYAGAKTGLSAFPFWEQTSSISGEYFGVDVSPAGDVNGDGFSDILIGSPAYFNGEQGEGKATLYLGAEDGLHLSANWSAESNQQDSDFGISAATAGDVNGDGFSDVIIGADLYDNGHLDEGAVFVYHGSETGLSPTYDWLAESDTWAVRFGQSVHTAGDVNGDGFSDVIIGVGLYENGEPAEGQALVYHGSSMGLSSTPSWSAEGNLANALFGTSVACAGDVNGDGFSDVVIGAPLYSNLQAGEGRAFVYHGSSTGLDSSPAWIGETDSRSGVFGSRYGFSVNTAGDVNGDGFSDIIIGASFYDDSSGTTGTAFVYQGSPAGLDSLASWKGKPGQLNSNYGWSVHTAGDVNGDGYSDVVVGAPNFDNGESEEGKVFVYHGGPTGLSVVSDWDFESNQNAAVMGRTVGTAGDINGDGYSDIVVAAPLYDGGETDEGAVFVFQGSEAGLPSAADWVGQSNQAEAQYGYCTGYAGDINGDGYSDIFSTALLFDGGVQDEGKAFVYYGNKGGNLSQKPRQYRFDLNSPLSPSSGTQGFPQFGIGITAKSPQGRTKGKLVWETTEEGKPFSKSTNLATSNQHTNEQSDYTDLGNLGVELKQVVDKRNFRTRIRARIAYHPVHALDGKLFSRWVYFGEVSSTGVGVLGNRPLPIEWLQFSGEWDSKYQGTELEWATTSNSPVGAFRVERSFDGIFFSPLGNIPITNNQDTEHLYTFFDANPQLGINYYRLKYEQTDGYFYHSDIISVLVSSIETKWELTPNPATDHLFLRGNIKTGAGIEILNANGKVVKRLESQKSGDRYEIRVGELLPGIYFLRVDSESLQSAMKFVKL